MRCNHLVAVGAQAPRPPDARLAMPVAGLCLGDLLAPAAPEADELSELRRISECVDTAMMKAPHDLRQSGAVVDGHDLSVTSVEYDGGR